MNKLSYRFVLCLLVIFGTIAPVFTHAQTHARTGEGSATVDNSTMIVSAGTTELRLSEVSYFGPNCYWEINGTLEIWSKKIWIAPTARFSGTGKIIIHNPGDNPYYELMADSPTEIDGNDGEFIGVTIELRNPHNLLLNNINDPGYQTINPNISSKSAALNIGAKFIFGVDDGDVILNGNDFGMSETANLEASAGTLGSRRMIVTGRTFEGHVIKHFGNTQPVLFPVGIEEGDYTPATIAPLSPVTIHMCVQSYDEALTAPVNREMGMDRVWHVMSDVAVNATYTLQHNRITNGLAYVDEKAEIAQYSGSNSWTGGVTVMENAAGVQGFGPQTISIHRRANIMMATDFLANQTWFTKLVAEAKTPPQAMDDQASGTSCDPIHINVLENDKPGSSAILVNSVRLIEQPHNGFAIVNLDGSITYTANDGFTGADYFVYEIRDEEGQTAQARVNLTIAECSFKIPNVFTPDGDGINDYFEIVGLELFDRVEILITNRWGNEVYRNDNYRNQWSGNNLNEGVYYYQITTHKAGQQKQYISWVLLKRNL